MAQQNAEIAGSPAAPCPTKPTPTGSAQPGGGTQQPGWAKWQRPAGSSAEQSAVKHSKVTALPAGPLTCPAPAGPRLSAPASTEQRQSGEISGTKNVSPRRLGNGLQENNI